MSLKTQISNDQVAAMKAKAHTDAEGKSALDEKITALRSAKTAITVAEKSQNDVELDETDVMAVLRSQVKKRREASEAYTKANRADLAAKEDREAAILEAYLPQMLDESATRSLIENIINEKNLQDAGMKGLGQVMSSLKSNDLVHKGLASSIAKELLA